MSDNEKNTGGWKQIIGGIALIVLLFVGIKFVFWGLEQAIPKRPTGASSGVSQDASAGQGGQEAPSFCVHCGEALPESFQWGQFCPWCGEKNEL